MSSYIRRILFCLTLVAATLSENAQKSTTEGPILPSTGCPKSFEGKCHCSEKPFPHFNSRRQYVVNCTSARFTDTIMLSDLPQQTEVLIFTGNMLIELDDNIFGFDFKFDKLNYIDFSNNHITFIRGQTFHRVKNVETLILNFNDIEITDRYERHRVFSNFKNLRYLHLTDAFTDRFNASAFYMLRLEDIFTESRLSNLERLHLEQNEISGIGSNASIFCPLASLQHLYVADNKLADLDFRIDCLPALSHVDARYNSITRLSDATMERMDKFVSGGKPLSLNLLNNPLVCDCRSKRFLHWLGTSGVKLDFVENYKCADGFPPENLDRNIVDVKHVSCPGSKLAGYSSGTVGFLSFLVAVMCVVVVVLALYHRAKLSSYVQPLVSDLTRKVGYRGLAEEELPSEVNV